MEIENFLKKALKGEILSQEQLSLINFKVRRLFLEENNLICLKGDFIIIGDLHGQFYDLLQIFQQFSNFEKNGKILVFLGDYIDRGFHGIETITLLLLLKIKLPKQVYLLRGNHETKQLSQIYGFFMECQYKFKSLKIWEEIMDTFQYFPLAAILNEKILALHGGISPNLKLIKQINEYNRIEDPQQDSILYNILWSDPQSQNGFSSSPRGSGYLFGQDVLQKFLQRNKLNYIIRSHQLCKDGYEIHFEVLQIIVIDFRIKDVSVQQIKIVIILLKKFNSQI